MNSPKQDRQKGAAVIEGALIFIPLILLILGMTDFVLGLWVKNTLQFSVREACRYAVTGQTQGGNGQVGSIQQAAQSNSMGLITAKAQVTVRFFDRAGRGEVTGAGSNAPGNVVQVSIDAYRWRWIIGGVFGLPAMSVRTSASDILEPTANGIPPAL